MDYSKNIKSGYMRIQLFFFNFAYLYLLIILFTEKSILSTVLVDSITIYLITIASFMVILNKQIFYLNIPNLITNFRLVINIFILVMVLNINNYDKNLVLFLSLMSISLDGIDGYLSRRLRQTTEFGYVFDQEVDNFLILILCFSIVYNHDYNLYILLIPFYRYIFLLLIQLKIISKDPLPDSFFRKSICVVLISSLIACNHYNTTESLSALLYLSIILLTYSFIRDIVWLYRIKNV